MIRLRLRNIRRRWMKKFLFRVGCVNLLRRQRLNPLLVGILVSIDRRYGRGDGHRTTRLGMSGFLAKLEESSHHTLFLHAFREWQVKA